MDRLCNLFRLTIAFTLVVTISCADKNAAQKKNINPKFRHSTLSSEIDTLNATQLPTTTSQDNSTAPIIAHNETLDNSTDLSLANASVMAVSNVTANVTAETVSNATWTERNVTSAPNMTSAFLNVTEDVPLFDLNATVTTEPLASDLWSVTEVTQGPNSSEFVTSAPFDYDDEDGDFNVTQVDEDYDEYDEYDDDDDDDDDDYGYEYYEVDDNGNAKNQWYYDVDGNYAEAYEKAVANGITKNHSDDDDENDDEVHDLSIAGFGNNVPNDKQWLQHVSSKLNERPVDAGLLKNRPGDGSLDVHIGPMKNYASLGGRPHHFSLGSMIRDNSLSLLVFYTWLGLLAFILLISVIVYKHRQRMSNFFWAIRTGYWRRGRDRVSQSSATEEGHTLLAHQRV